MPEMRRWRIQGLHRDTGEAMDWIVEVFTEDEARAMAFENACVVSEVTELGTVREHHRARRALRELAQETIDREDEEARERAKSRVFPWRERGWQVRKQPALPVYPVADVQMSLMNILSIAFGVGLGISCVAPIIAFFAVVIGAPVMLAMLKLLLDRLQDPGSGA